MPNAGLALREGIGLRSGRLNEILQMHTRGPCCDNYNLRRHSGIGGRGSNSLSFLAGTALWRRWNRIRPTTLARANTDRVAVLAQRVRTWLLLGTSASQQRHLPPAQSEFR